jgi:hypothetical protein
LPAIFYKVKGKGSLSDLFSWLAQQPLVMPDDTLASYETIERVALSVGLAMRDLAAKQFVEDSELPEYMVNSAYEFRQHEKLSDITQDLVSGFDDLYVIIHLFGSH